MHDDRLDRYARLLVEYCLEIKPERQVLISAPPVAEPLVERVAMWVARRESYALIRLQPVSAATAWAREAPMRLLAMLPPAERKLLDQIDAHIRILAHDEEGEIGELPAGRRRLLNQAAMPVVQRHLNAAMPWVTCHYPSDGLAMQAGLSPEQFTDLLYGAVLRDWEQERVVMERIKIRFDHVREVRIVGDGTDLTVSLQGRVGMIDDGRRNVPGGEVFYSPVEESVNGEISFAELPAIYGGQVLEGVRLVIRDGEVTEAHAVTGEEYLRQVLATDEGARRIGEFGIGCNTGITACVRNALFDEKMSGTVHLALGQGFPPLGGTNVSRIHWDLVKDLRGGGALYCDGQIVQSNGQWLTFDTDDGYRNPLTSLRHRS
jgi:aminopeptidase